MSPPFLSRGRRFVIPLCAWLGLFACLSRADEIRIISLSPSLTELICDMGLTGLLAGRSSACDYPPSVVSVPVVGDFGRPNWERIIQLRPTVVVATDLERPAMMRRLREEGIATLLLPCEGWEPLLAAARAIAEAAGQSQAGEEWVSRMQSRRESLQQRVSSFYAGRARPRVYAEVWGRPLTTPARDTFLNDVITLAGGDNVAASLSGKYVHISAEWVVRQDPDVILLAYMLESGAAAANLKARVGWASMRAMRDGSICQSIPPDHLLRPGPRLMDGAEALAEWLMQWSQTFDRASDDPRN